MLGVDKGFDVVEFVVDFRQVCVILYVVQKLRYLVIDVRIIWYDGYVLLIKYCKWIEEVFGWVKIVGGMVQIYYCGVEWVCVCFILMMVVNNFV